MKKEPIYREDVVRAIMSLPNCENGFSDTYDKSTIISVVEDVPSVICCKDCKHSVPCEKNSEYRYYCKFTTLYNKASFFCANGKEKNE